MKIDDQREPAASSHQVGFPLGFVLGQDLFDGFKLDDQLLINEDIHASFAALMPFVFHLNRALSLKCNCP